MTRDELVRRTRQLIAEGERLEAQPSRNALQTWLQLSDELLSTAWGTMDRYHLAWLMVGKPKGIIRGRTVSEAEEAAEVREVASQKTAALRMSLDAVERQGMPFRGETGGVGAGQGMGELPGSPVAGEPGTGPAGTSGPNGTNARFGSQRQIPLDPALERRLEEAREEANRHQGHGERRAPRPERLQR